MGRGEHPLTGGCHCGAVRYQIAGTAAQVSVCHCVDCRRCAGATGIAWATFSMADLSVSGDVAVYASSLGVERRFCLICGTGLFYQNSDMPGHVDVQVATLDDPDRVPPTRHVQLADAVSWEAGLHLLPGHQRFAEG